ncbi:beta strand repeat-containing protein [Pontiella sulfatireligans]|uniref:Uncharacterized protein n=1 Tax=Pontiella sulfatireligans TaxID=2750658 RepID=A0A6C2UDV1_9BACT|nr:hypothetical protein [Pontiella sulfatireligans]VGO18315.1 hypothetical protein SCARR_00367 [Pontiella sulfatireligans]
MRIGIKKLTTIMAGLLCAAVMSTQAEPFSKAFKFVGNTAGDILGTNVTVTSTAITGPDGLATFNVSYDISTFPAADGKGTNVVAYDETNWGIDGTGGASSQFYPGEAATIHSPAVVNFNANGGNMLESDITGLSLQRITVGGAGGGSDSGSVAANGIANTWLDANAGVPQFLGHLANAVDLHVMTASSSVQSVEIAGVGGAWRASSTTVAGNMALANSTLAVDPSSLSMTMNDPEVSTNGTIDASIVFGSSANDIEIISTVTDDADFTADKDGTTLTSLNTNETITVTYNNTGDLVDNGNSDSATLTITWTAAGSLITNTTDVALDVTYYVVPTGPQPSSPELIIGWNVWPDKAYSPNSVTNGAIGSAVGTDSPRVSDAEGSVDGTWGTLAVPSIDINETSAIKNFRNRTYQIQFTLSATGNRTILDSFHFDALYNNSTAQNDWTLSVLSGTISTGVVATGTIAAQDTWEDFDVDLTGIPDRDLGPGGTAVFELAWTGGTPNTTAANATIMDNVGITARIPVHSVVGIDPAALSLILVDPETSTNGSLNASFFTGVVSNDVEIISTLTDVADFGVVLSGTTLNAGNPAETITVTYINPGDLVNNGDATNSTLSVEWTAVGSGVTNITEVSLDVVYSKFTLAGPVTDRSMSTPNDRLRVAFQYAGADSVELAVRNAADDKLEFTAYDNHAANTARAIYTTKTGVPSAVTNQATDFTESGFFSYINEPFTVNVPVDNSGEALNVVELVDLVNTAWTWKDNVDENVVFIDLASISEISNLVSDVVLTIEITAKAGASTLTSEVDVTITPDGTVSYSFVANGASFAETNGIEIGSNEGGSLNRFTGNNRHLLLSAGSDQDQVATTTGIVNDKAFGMFFDTDGGSFPLDNILINLSTDNTPVIPAGALLKLELWKINAVLGDLSTTNVATTFPDPELVFTGTGVFPGTYNDDDLYMIDLPDITLAADTRYGWALRWNTIEPAALVIGVDRGVGDVGGSFDGNHLRLNKSNEMFPFYGVTDGEGAGAWDIVFHLRSGDPGTYEAWVGGYGLSGPAALRGADPENSGLGDGYDNLMEYALGMDPTAEDAGSKESVNTVAEGSTNYFEYVHDRRSDYVKRSLTYDLIDTENLIYQIGLATNSQDEVNMGTAVGSYETVTNRYITDKSVQFIELEVQQAP